MMSSECLAALLLFNQFFQLSFLTHPTVLIQQSMCQFSESQTCNSGMKPTKHLLDFLKSHSFLSCSFTCPQSTNT